MNAFRNYALLLLLTHANVAVAATIRVHVERGRYVGPVLLEIAAAHDEKPPQSLISKRLAGDAAHASFTLPDRGVFLVMASGPEPLQRMTAKVAVASDDVRNVDIALPARRAEGRITIGGVPLAGVTLQLRHRTWHWYTEVVADAQGVVRGALWEGGRFDVVIRGGPLAAPIRAQTQIDGAPTAKFAIDVPARSIRGRVIDGKGSPVANATIIHRAQRSGMPTVTRASTDARGVFEYAGIHPGPHTFEVVAEGYLLPERFAVDVGENAALTEISIAVEAGSPRPIEVFDSRGKPVAGAMVMCTTDAKLRAVARTDERGRALLATPPSEHSVAWISPHGGSFAGIPLHGNAPAAATPRIVVPAPTASLDVETLTTAGAAVPHVSLLMRYNGMIVPPAVAGFLRKQRIELSTDDHGRAKLALIPPGIYEFWPYRSEAEAEALLISAVPLAAPINIHVVPGENRVAVRFQKTR